MGQSGVSMNFEWQHYLKLAKELLNNPNIPCCTESKLRAAISKAYYASFCIARNHLRDNENVQAPNLQRPNVFPHHFVIKKFLDQNNDSFKRNIGNLLKRLRKNRNLVDYEDKINSNLHSLANASISFAEQTISDVGKL